MTDPQQQNDLLAEAAAGTVAEAHAFADSTVLWLDVPEEPDVMPGGYMDIGLRLEHVRCLLARVRALEEDGKRLDWLERNGRVQMQPCEWDANGCAIRTRFTLHNSGATRVELSYFSDFATIREAVDEGMWQDANPDMASPVVRALIAAALSAARQEPQG